MNDLIVANLQKKLESYSGKAELGGEVRRNALKEELQYYVLNFIYHHPDYSRWVMYGGSALRICYGLDRMSVDLDFEVSHPINASFLEHLRDEVRQYFASTYGTSPDFLRVKVVGERGLLLIFAPGKELVPDHQSNQVHVKIDLNHFVAPNTPTERFPINHSQLSFVILTYNMSTLMASKIAAIFLRGTRGVGKELYEEKGRDIYDLLWYMGKKVVPDLSYLAAKQVDIADPRALFDRLTLQINKVSNTNLRNDLLPLFSDRTYIEHWLEHWLESYLHLLEGYRIHTIDSLETITVWQDIMADIFFYTYFYRTNNGKRVQIRYSISDYWMGDKDITEEIDPQVEEKLELRSNGWTSKPAFEKKLKRFATLFLHKTETYFKKNNQVVVGDTISTKLIRMTADNLDRNEQIVLTRSALISCELEDLLR